MEGLSSGRWKGWTGGCVYGVILGVVYRDALAYLWRQWNKEDFSYGYLLPFVLAYVAWQRRDALAAEPTRPSWAGLLAVAAGLALFWLGELGGEFYTLQISLWLTVAGLLWLHLGLRKLRAVAFPLGMALALFPPPNFIYLNLSLRLKLASSALGVWLIQFFGGSAYREGNVIDLGVTKLQVVDACSGLRYVFPLLVMALLIAWSRHRSWWKRALLVISAIPVSVVVNAVRIALTGVLTTLWGPAAAEGKFHDTMGWVLFLVSCGVLALESELMRRLVPDAQGFEASGERTAPEKGTESSYPEPRSSGLWLRFSVAVLLLGITLALSCGVDFRRVTPLRRPLAELPLDLPGWKGKPQVMEAQFINALAFTDYAMVDYGTPDGKVVSLYVAYYATQSKGESIHSPETCLPGSGWVFRRSGTVEVASSDGRSIRVNRAFMDNGARRELVYFWFPQRGRTLTSLPQLKLYTFWDALTRHRTDGSLVRLITPVADGETDERTEERLKRFTQQIVPVLNRYLPE